MPGYAVFRQVADNPTRPRRYADAIVMGLWKSRGFYLQGVEIKCSRSDVLSELRDPAKSDEIMRFCDYWWLLAAPDTVSKDELPETWGLLTVAKNGQGLTAVKRPTYREPYSIPRTFLASILRRSAERRVGMEEHVNLEVNRQMRERNLIDRRECDAQQQQMQQELTNLKQRVYQFERAFGASITRPLSRDGLGRAAALLRDMGNNGSHMNTIASVQRAEEQMQSVARKLSELKEAIRNIDPEKGQEGESSQT